MAIARMQIGSVGPCTQGQCGMMGKKTAKGVDVTYIYTYGCENTFTISLTGGSDKGPGPVTSNECTYTTSWATAGLGPPPSPPVMVRCTNNTCVKAPKGVPGMSNATCQQGCGAPSPCLMALVGNCESARYAAPPSTAPSVPAHFFMPSCFVTCAICVMNSQSGGDGACMYCAGTNAGKLHAAGCSQPQIAAFCKVTL